MSYDWPKTVQTPARDATVCLPPARVAETSWDILLALHSDSRCELTLSRLASVASVTEAGLSQHLATLEQNKLITGAQDQSTGEIRAFLTAAGRTLLDQYLSATSELQVSAHQ
jgi:DNA-binding MarR family transcriptional regulator